jgi:hypothetical protein
VKAETPVEFTSSETNTEFLMTPVNSIRLRIPLMRIVAPNCSVRPVCLQCHEKVMTVRKTAQQFQSMLDTTSEITGLSVAEAE